MQTAKLNVKFCINIRFCVRCSVLFFARQLRAQYYEIVDLAKESAFIDNLEQQTIGCEQKKSIMEANQI